MEEKARRFTNLSGYIALFVFSFVFFLYLTFPYEVLKETIASAISKQSSFTVHMKHLKSRIPLGLRAEKVRIESTGGKASLEFAKVTVDASLLSLLVGGLGGEVTIESANGGTIKLFSRFKLFPLLTSGQLIPSEIDFDAEKFPLDDLTRFSLTTLANSPDANPTVAPLLGKIGFTGLMDANVRFKIDSSDATQSEGQAEIKLSNATLVLQDPALSLPDQKFEKSLVLAKMQGGALKIDKTTGFKAPELEVGAEGKINLKPALSNSVLDLKIDLKLDKTLKSQFGFILDAVPPSGSRNGELTLMLRGTVGDPNPTPI